MMMVIDVLPHIGDGESERKNQGDSPSLCQ